MCFLQPTLQALFLLLSFKAVFACPETINDLDAYGIEVPEESLGLLSIKYNGNLLPIRDLEEHIHSWTFSNHKLSHRQPFPKLFVKRAMEPKSVDDLIAFIKKETQEWRKDRDWLKRVMNHVNPESSDKSKEMVDTVMQQTERSRSERSIRDDLKKKASHHVKELKERKRFRDALRLKKAIEEFVLMSDQFDEVTNVIAKKYETYKHTGKWPQDQGEVASEQPSTSKEPITGEIPSTSTEPVTSDKPSTSKWPSGNNKKNKKKGKGKGKGKG